MLQLHSQPEASGTGKRLRINPGEGRGPAGLLTQEKAEQQQGLGCRDAPQLGVLGNPKKAHSACHPPSLWPEIPSHGMVCFGRSLPGTGSASQRLAFRLRAASAAVASGQLGAVTAIGHLHRDG